MNKVKVTKDITYRDLYGNEDQQPERYTYNLDDVAIPAGTEVRVRYDNGGDYTIGLRGIFDYHIVGKEFFE